MIDQSEISTAALNKYKKVRVLFLSETIYVFCYKKIMPWWSKPEKRNNAFFFGFGFLYFGIQFRIPTN